MIDIRTRALVAGGVAALAVFTGRVPAGADAIELLSLQTGHSIILNADGLNRVAVGDGRIAGVVPVGTSQVVVNGKAPGHTTIFVWSAIGRTTYEVTVTEQSFDDIARVLRAAINEPSVQVVAFGVNLIVRGTVPDVAAYQRVQGVLDRFKGIKFSSGGSSSGVIINAVSVSKPLGNLQDEIAAIPGGHDLRVDADDKGNVVVSGTVRDATEAQHVLDRVKGLAGPYLATDGKVIDRLATDETSQIDIKVYVLEVDNTAQKNLGLQLQSAQPQNVSTGVTGTQTYTVGGPTQIVGIDTLHPGNPFALGPFSAVSLLAPTLNLLITQGHAKILSSPNLVTEPGLEATFLVGGEIPIPVSNGLGTVSITYKDYGVKLNVTPTILGNGGVEAKIAPEVSQLDFADGISLNGFVVPALKTSKLATDVITSNGESVILGGLLSRVESRNIVKFPILGDIPILGQLFRSTSYQHNDTDVVFVMTPTIVSK